MVPFAGLSMNKAKYILNLMRECEKGGILADPGLSRAEDEAFIQQSTRIKGIGPWTAKMVLMFHLHRPDVLPVEDLGVKKGMKVFFNLPDLPKPALMEDLTRDWSPHRSSGVWFMWQLADTKM